MNQNYRQYSYSYFLDSMNIAGYKSVELWLGAPHIWVDWSSFHCAEQILRQTRDAGLEILSVTTPSGGAFQYQYASQEAYHRERSIRYFLNGVRTTAALDCPLMTVNSGWGYWSDPESAAYCKSVETISAVCREAEKLGVTIAIESLTKDESLIGYTIDQIARLVNDVSSPALKLMVDLDATWFSKETMEDWFVRFGNDLVHCHFQDGDLSSPSDAHLPWGKGEFLLREELAVLEKFGYKGILTQEICDSTDPRADDIWNMRTLEAYLED